MNTKISTMSVTDNKSVVATATALTPPSMDALLRPVANWVRTQFVRKYVDKVSRLLERAIKKAQTTAEIDMLNNLIIKEFQECETILAKSYHSVNYGKNCVQIAKEGRTYEQ